MWSDSDNLEKIVGDEGFVSGWGVTEDGKAKIPSYVMATVVDRQTCNRNLDRLFAAKARIFCADGHGSVPCTGDSGSGFVIKRGPRYYIRGIVSFGQFDPKTLTCATDKYVVYTDIAPFRYWLTRNNVGSISLYKSTSQTVRDIKKNKPAWYRVNFPYKNILPSVVAIRVNGRTICAGRRASNTESSISLQHTIYPSV
uniref:Peptidase S1 domain-containing protein n=1 Tax=Anopheles coluzzii TaxID=1518534 RepID=A0A8W7PNL3_ANOCL